MSERRAKRERIGKTAAYRLKQAGLTNSQIANELGIQKEKVPKMIMLGERIASISDDESAPKNSL